MWHGSWEPALPAAMRRPDAVLHCSPPTVHQQTCALVVPPAVPQEWNEIQFNGVYYEPPEVGYPGVLEEGKSYTFKYPRPER
jgi:1,4-alpha-glucan branching enzyme